MDKTYRNYIDGRWVEGNGRTLQVLNPATDKVIAHVPDASADDIDRAVAAAKKAQPAWERLPASHPARKPHTPDFGKDSRQRPKACPHLGGRAGEGAGTGGRETDALADKVTTLMASTRYGDPSIDKNLHMGPLVTKVGRDRMAAMVDAAKGQARRC